MADTDQEILEVVDADDRVVGHAARSEIHRRGLLHRAVHVFVFDSQGNIYVQRRSASKDRHPLKLDSSAAGHVDPGESYRETAYRELEEELGIRSELEEVLRVPASAVTDNEHVVLFTAVTGAKPVPNFEEILDGRFLEAHLLTKIMAEDPEDFVPAFRMLWKEFLGRRT
jgi:isopentenyl-diphosphate Delta-isomerase